MKRIIFALLLATFLSSPVFADDNDIMSLRNKADSAEIWKVDENGQMQYQALVETNTTSQTVVAADSGREFFSNISTGTLTYTLPTAAAGLTFTFTSINGNAISGQGKIILEPTDADTFVACVNGTSATTFAAGDSLSSPNATGDSVKIVSSAAGSWICTDRIGTWTDTN